MVLPYRDALHQLVDTSPEAALEAAEGILQSSQTWRPEPPRDVATMREDVKQLFAKGPEETIENMREQMRRKGITAPQSFPTFYSHRKASGAASEGETLVTFTIWCYQWHELEIEERFSVSEDMHNLLYSQHIQGPKGKIESFEIGFDCR